MKKSYFVYVIFLLGAGLASCGGDDDTVSTNDDLVGTWSKQYNGISLVITFSDGGSLTVALGDEAFTGTYSTTGNEVTMNTSDCDSPGKYNYSVNSNKMTLSKISDDCEGRKDAAAGEYNRI